MVYRAKAQTSDTLAHETPQATDQQPLIQEIKEESEPKIHDRKKKENKETAPGDGLKKKKYENKSQKIDEV